MSLQLAEGCIHERDDVIFAPFICDSMIFKRIYYIWKKTAAEPPLTPKIAISQQNIFAISL